MFGFGIFSSHLPYIILGIVYSVYILTFSLERISWGNPDMEKPVSGYLLGDGYGGSLAYELADDTIYCSRQTLFTELLITPSILTIGLPETGSPPTGFFPTASA